MATHGSWLELTYEDYVHFPDDGRRHELIDGDHSATGSPNTRHQLISVNLARTLGGFVFDHDLGELFFAPFDVVLSPIDVVQPDLLSLRNEHLDRLTEAHLRGAPDLVVEIVSESTRGRDEVAKRHLYARHGVSEYWIVDPVTETVKVYRLEGGATTCESPSSRSRPAIPSTLHSSPDSLSPSASCSADFVESSRFRPDRALKARAATRGPAPARPRARAAGSSGSPSARPASPGRGPSAAGG